MDFDYKKFEQMRDMLKKAQFVPMDPAMAGGDPSAAAGGMPPQGDPAAAGMPPDPAAAGAPPMDPSMAGAMPPMDPAALGMPPMDGGDVSPTGEPYMKITPTQLSKLFKQFAEVFKSVLGIQSAAPGQPAPAAAPAPQQDPNQQQQLAELNAKLDALINA